MSNDTIGNNTNDDSFANFSYPGMDASSPANSGSQDDSKDTMDENVPKVELDNPLPVSSGTDSTDMKPEKPQDLDAQMANLSGLSTPEAPPPKAISNEIQEGDLSGDNPSQSSAESGDQSNEKSEAPPVLGEGEVKTESEESTSPLKALANRLSSIKGGLVEDATDESKEDMEQKVDAAATMDPTSDSEIVEQSESQDLANMQDQISAENEEMSDLQSDGSVDESPMQPEVDINAPTPLTDQLVSDTPVPSVAGSEIQDQPIVQMDPNLNDTGGKDMNAPVQDSTQSDQIGTAQDDAMEADPQQSTDIVQDLSGGIEMSGSSLDSSMNLPEDVNESMQPSPVVDQVAQPDETQFLNDENAYPEPPPETVMPPAPVTPEPPPMNETNMAPPLPQVALEADEADPLVGGDDGPKVAHTRYPYTIEQLLDIVVEKDASDLHITVGYPAMIRVDGALINVLEELVTEKQAMDLILPVLPEQKKELLDVNREVDLAHAHHEDARFRINAYYQKQTLAGAFRLIPNRIRSIDELNLPQIYHQLTKLKQGLVLVTGPTGSGKSTTLAAILQEINESRPDHIITIEDPVEYILPRARAMVDQRELHEDTHSWEIAMRSALRQDPDVILVGEMRDYETIAAAITLAETGHLVFATLHTNSAAQTLDRMVDVFPEHQQSQVRSQLSNTIEAVIAQRLMPINRGGRVAVSEIMIATPAIRNLIREAKTHQIDNVIRTSADIGMISLEHTLVKMVRDNTITMERAQEYAVHPEEVVRLLKS